MSTKIGIDLAEATALGETVRSRLVTAVNGRQFDFETTIGGYYADDFQMHFDGPNGPEIGGREIVQNFWEILAADVAGDPTARIELHVMLLRQHRLTSDSVLEDVWGDLYVHHGDSEICARYRGNRILAMRGEDLVYVGAAHWIEK